MTKTFDTNLNLVVVQLVREWKKSHMRHPDIPLCSYVLYMYMSLCGHLAAHASFSAKYWSHESYESRKHCCSSSAIEKDLSFYQRKYLCDCLVKLLDTLGGALYSKCKYNWPAWWVKLTRNIKLYVYLVAVNEVRSFFISGWPRISAAAAKRIQAGHWHYEHTMNFWFVTMYTLLV